MVTMGIGNTIKQKKEHQFQSKTNRRHREEIRTLKMPSKNVANTNDGMFLTTSTIMGLGPTKAAQMPTDSASTSLPLTKHTGTCTSIKT